MTEEEIFLRLFPYFNRIKIMTSFEISNKIAINIINFLLRKNEANVKTEEEPKITNHETYNEYDGDIMDYDGMGNYGRFPCETK